MKKIFRTLLCLLTAVVTVLCVSATTSANGLISYQGSSEKFIFTSGSNTHPNDLFDQFKNVMPGDTLTQKITIRNDAAYNVKVRLYVRALDMQSGSEDFLSQLHLTVQKSGKTPLFDAPANQKFALDDWVYLGLLYCGGTMDLDLTLDVPLTLDDSYQDATGILRWEFMAVEYPREPDDPQPPKTGASYLIWPSVCVLAASAVVFILVTKRKRREEA